MEVDASFIIILVLQCIFYTFHLSILLLMVVKRNSVFKGGFYNVLRIVLVADFGSFISTLIAQKLSNIDYFKDFYKNSIILPSFMTCYTTFILGIQYLGRFFMAFNRFTAIWAPLKYERIWRKQWYTVLLILLPFLTIGWRMHVNVRYTYLGNGNVLVVYADPNLRQLLKVLYSSTNFAPTLGAAIFNGLSFTKFYYQKHRSSNYSLNEQHLLYMSITIFIAQLGRISFTLSQLLFPTDENVIAFFSAALPYLTDALSFSGSVSFFVLSKTARKEYAMFYFNKKSNIIASMVAKSLSGGAKLVRHK